MRLGHKQLVWFLSNWIAKVKTQLKKATYRHVKQWQLPMDLKLIRRGQTSAGVQHHIIELQKKKRKHIGFCSVCSTPLVLNQWAMAHYQARSSPPPLRPLANSRSPNLPLCFPVTIVPKLPMIACSDSQPSRVSPGSLRALHPHSVPQASSTPNSVPK